MDQVGGSPLLGQDMVAKVFEGRAEAQVRMQITIGQIESVWISQCWLDPNDNAVFLITEVALNASKRMKGGWK